MTTAPPQDEPRADGAPPAARRKLDVAPLQGFRPDVQALRGLAVLLVVLYHAKFGVHGGFIGVDVFFVISGFVIGRRLVARANAGRADRGEKRAALVEFYVHRARRILPALAAMLVVVIVAAPLLAPIGGVAKTSSTGIAAALFSANFYLYKASAVGYFDAAATLNPLLHTWSLSVEEQFYFVIPVLVFVAWWFGRRHWRALPVVRLLLAAILVVSFALCVKLTLATGTVLHVDGRRFAFYSPFTRAWEFAVGLALVVLPTRAIASAVLRPLLLVVGLAMILGSAFAFSDGTVFPGYAALLPVVGAALVIHAGTRRGAPADPRTPDWLRPATWLGDVSYSWYLWHWPFIVFAAGFWPGGGSTPLLIAAVLSLVPAWLSYRLLERPLRATPRTRTRPTVVLAVVCIVAPIIAVGIAKPVRSYVDQRATAHFAALFDAHGNQLGDTPACNNATPLGQRPAGSCTAGSASSRTAVVLVGDSNAAQFSDTLAGAAEADGARLQIATLQACPFADITYELPGNPTTETSPTDCHAFVTGTVDALVAQRPSLVVLAEATDQWVYLNPVPMADPGGTLTSDVAEKARIFQAGITRIVARLRGAGIRVAVVDVVPKPYQLDPRDCSNLAVLVDSQRCLPADFSLRSRTDMVRANTLQAAAAKLGGGTVWGFNDQICPGGTCSALRDGALTWRDPVHISDAVAKALIPAATTDLRDTLSAPLPTPQPTPQP